MIFKDNFTKAKQLFEDVGRFHYYFLLTKFYNNNVHETWAISVNFFFLISECQSGYFGKDCLGRCSVNCYDTSICDRFTGHCTRGCKQGWTGNMCDKRIFLNIILINLGRSIIGWRFHYLISNDARILGGFPIEIHT